jgi:predicted transcriptional regulator
MRNPQENGMTIGATRNDVAVAALNLVEAYLRNPNTSVAPKDMVALIREVHDTAMFLGSDAAPAALPAPAAAPLALPAPVGSGPAPDYADADGNWDSAKVWPGVERERRDLFTRLVDEHYLVRDARGIPQPRRPRDKLISPDTMTVVDPITGENFAMLKRRLDINYGLTHGDILDMFDLTDEELPSMGPGFKASKSRAALKSGLGHHRKAKAKEAGAKDTASKSVRTKAA